VFQECPSCQSRYCASGCLQSWYDHCKPARAAPIHSPVVSAEEDYLTLCLPDGEVELGLTRIAGGCLIAGTAGTAGAEAKSSRGEKRRWGVTSVDGWILGTPGPGPDWLPAPGVKLCLEDLGHCRTCKEPLAIAEYICNSARSSRPTSASRWAVQRPRTRTAEAETQTMPSQAEAEVQATYTSVEVAVQATPPPGAVTASAHAAIAGSCIAALASPVEDKPGEVPKEISLTRSPDLARARIRNALAAMARLMAMVAPSVRDDASDAQELQRAVAAVKKIGMPEVDTSGDSDADRGLRVLGKCSPAAIPKFKPGPDGDHVEPHFQPGSAAALVGGALAALDRLDRLDRTSNAPAEKETQRPSSSLTGLRSESEESECLLMEHGTGKAGATSELQEPLLDAVLQIAALLCLGEGQHDEGLGASAALAFAAVSRLAPPLSIVPWRHLARPSAWQAKPRGWSQIRDALAALAELAEGVPGMSTLVHLADEEGPLCRAIKALVRLALFADSEAVARAAAAAAAEAAAAAAAAEAAAAAAAAATPATPAAQQESEVHDAGVPECPAAEIPPTLPMVPPVAALPPESQEPALGMLKPPIFGKASSDFAPGTGPGRQSDPLGVPVGDPLASLPTEGPVDKNLQGAMAGLFKKKR